MPTILEEKTTSVKKERKSFLPQLRSLSQKLTDIESDLAMFWRCSPSMIIILRNDIIKAANPKALEYLKIEADDIVGKPLYSLAHKDDHEKVYRMCQKLKTSGVEVKGIIRSNNSTKEHWNYLEISLSYEPESDSIFCVAKPLLNKCKDCPFT